MITLGDFHLAEIWLVKSNGKQIILKASSTNNSQSEIFYKGIDFQKTFNYDEGLPGKIWKNKKVEIWDDLQNNKEFLRKISAKDAKLQSAIGIPLLNNDSVIGVLMIASPTTKQELNNLTKVFAGFESYLGAEIKRKQLEEELRQFFDYSPEILVVAGPEHLFRNVNPAFASLLGYTQEEMTSIPFIEFIHPDDLNDTNSEYSDTLENDNVTLNFINRYRTKSGQWKWISWSSSKVFGDDKLFYGFGRDITEEKKLRILLDEASTLARIGGWEVDLITNKVTWSDITKEIHEVPLDYEPHIDTVLDFYKKYSKIYVQSIIEESIQTGKPFDFEMPIVTELGNERWIRAMAKMEVANGKTVRMFGSVQDVHEKKNTEEELQRKSVYLATISEINSLLLNSEHWLEAIHQSFIKMSDVLTIDAIHLFDYESNINGSFTLIRRIDSNRGDYHGNIQSDLFEKFTLETILENSESKNKKRIFSLSPDDCKDIEIKNTLINQKILSLCIAPIYDRKNITSFISIIDCNYKRKWNSEEIEFISTLVSNYSAAIEKQKAQSSLLNKTKLLEINAEVVELFLLHDDWEEALPICLEKMGIAIDSDRSYYLQNYRHPETNELYTRYAYEWTNGKVSVEITNPDYQAIRLSDHPVFLDLALKGKEFMFLTTELDGVTKEVLEEQDIQSILHIPIMVFGEFYGYIGFDDCYREKRWNEEEISFVKTLASNLSSAIERFYRNNQISEALKEKNSILERITEGFFAVDRNWQVIYWNQVVEAASNTKKEDALGKNFWEVFPDAKDLSYYKFYHQALETGETVHFEDYYKPVDRWFDISAYPSESGLSVYLRDITLKKKSEAEIKLANERFEKVTQATNDAIWDWNILNGTLNWGIGFQNIFGYQLSPDMPNTDSWTDYIHPDDLTRVTTSINASIEDPIISTWREEYRFKKIDGTYAYIIDRGTIIRDNFNNAIRMVGAMTDISHRKEYEISLKSLNEELEKHTRELEISNRELEQFAYVASHDLQEPLRMVTSFLTQLEKKYKDILDDKAKTYIRFAVDGAFRMRQIILDLLDFSRVGEFYEEKVEIDIAELIDEACHFQRKNIEKYSIQIIKNKLPIILNHRTPVLQIFQNLISNSIKYSKKDNTPRIEINYKSETNYWQFSVQDNGIGIEEEYFEKIFIIFQRLHAREEYGGTGMGLSIVKKIVESLGGKIWVESVVDVGTTIHFTIKK